MGCSWLLVQRFSFSNLTTLLSLCEARICKGYFIALSLSLSLSLSLFLFLFFKVCDVSRNHSRFSSLFCVLTYFSFISMFHFLRLAWIPFTFHKIMPTKKRGRFPSSFPGRPLTTSHFTH